MASLISWQQPSSSQLSPLASVSDLRETNGVEKETRGIQIKESRKEQIHVIIIIIIIIIHD